MFAQIISLATWLLLPVSVIVIVDDWFLRPRRRLAALPAAAVDPAPLRLLYAIFPLLVIAGAVRLFRSERLDFSLVLVIVSVVGGLIWALDAWWLRGRRAASAMVNGQNPAAVPEPGVVDYARSMVPVVVVVLLLRSFLFEPFRIPTDSMMPTLQAGDFILVNKYHYGLRLPVLNKLFLKVNEPQRGDVIVFRYPPDPAINYIKRVVGLPGDRIKVVGDLIYVNDVPLKQGEPQRYSDGCYENMRLTEVQTGTHRHQTLSCLSPRPLPGAVLPSCNRRIDRGYVCDEGIPVSVASGILDANDFEEVTVPAGNYMVIGDNRDNSSDSRVWGFVPEANLVGSARRIWFNIDLARSPWVNWARIGKRIE
ncbi:MAG: signal peptidase I [Steroidobacteraceae bacterium]